MAGKVVYHWEGGGVSIRMCDFEKWHSLNGSVLLRYYLICLYSLCLYIIATIIHMEVLLQPRCLSPNKSGMGEYIVLLCRRHYSGLECVRDVPFFEAADDVLHTSVGFILAQI